MVSSSRNRSHLGALVCAFTLLFGCTGEMPRLTGDVAEVDPLARSSRTLTSYDGTLSVPVPGDLDAHRLDSMILASVADGSFRLAVSIEAEQRLMVAAGQGKETLLARGWLIEGEQHYQKAILARFRKGGNATRPNSRREIWWIQGVGSLVVCDGVASKKGFGFLGEDLRSLCRSVSIQPVLRPEPAPPEPDDASP